MVHEQSHSIHIFIFAVNDFWNVCQLRTVLCTIGGVQKMCEFWSFVTLLKQFKFYNKVTKLNFQFIGRTSDER